MSQDQGQDDRHDDVLQKGNSLMEEDRREKIATCDRGIGIRRTKLRRVRCRARMQCKDFERAIMH